MRQFTNPLILLLAIAVILSATLGQSSDTYIILFILLFSGLLGFFQEMNAGRAFEKLNSMIETRHNVLRDGTVSELPAAAIVPGDIVILDAGDIIPADCRIVESNELHVNESALTGESFPVEKMPGVVNAEEPLNKKFNCLWQGSNVISGTARALVVHTGEHTIFGSMAQALREQPEAAFQKGIRRFGYFLLRITIVLSLVILLANLYFGKPLFDSVLFSLALSVGMAPELLPAIMTITMSAGARHMMKKKVIVKKLSSIFSLGSVDVLCMDKTGTITEGVVRINDITDPDGNTSEYVRKLAWLNASFQQGFVNPIDQALAALPFTDECYEKINEVPYDFFRKRLSVALKKEQDNLVVTKGAFMSVLEVCSRLSVNGIVAPLDAQRRVELEKKFIATGENGYRVLGIAEKNLVKEKMSREDEQDMTFLGFILLEDPMKETAGSSISEIRKLGIDIKIITGDNRYSAIHAARQIGMPQPKLLTGGDLDLLSPEALVIKAKETDVFAETGPYQKDRIIRALRVSNRAVAYIGDGINDVAAIHAADVGISTNNAVAVAKEAADFVLLEKDISVLAEGVVEGRKSFANCMKYIFITTGATFGNMLSMAGASLFLPFLPMLPKQILLTNLITDLPFLTIASDRVDKIETQRAGKWDLRMIRNFMIVFGIHSSVFDFITFYFLYLYFRLSGPAFQTGWFLESAVTELLIIFIVRSRRSLFVTRPGRMLLLFSLTALVITMFLPFSPFATAFGFSIENAQVLMALALILTAYVITGDIVKIAFFRSSEKTQTRTFNRQPFMENNTPRISA